MMSNYADCPNCGIEIDATAAALTGYCPECDTPFGRLVEIATDDADPEDAGPYYEVEP
jgi:hypothetical protein